MRIAVHHLRRRLIKRAGSAPCLAFPRLRSSMMAGVIGTPACPRANRAGLTGLTHECAPRSSNQDQIVV